MKRFAAVLVLALAVPAAFAFRIPGRSPDRKELEPLRGADLAAALDGRATGDAWRAAATKLPDKCRQPEVLTGSDCNEDARCGWLAARAAALDAVARRDLPREVTDRLHRAAQRLAIGRCVEADENWRADARTAALDDARASLALLLALGSTETVLDGDDQTMVDTMIAGARRGGVSSADENALTGARTALRRCAERRLWLTSVPALARARTVLLGAWAPAGVVPKDCGADLARTDLLEDQWRGYLVRESVPRALDCVSSRLLPALSKRGVLAADPAAAATLARGLADEARADIGGRQFGADPAVQRRFDQLAAALGPATGPRPSTTAAAGRAAAPAVTRPGAASSSPAVAAAAPRTVPALAPPAAVPSSTSPSARDSGGGGVRPDPVLARLAARVAEYAGPQDAARIAAGRPMSLAERERVERTLIVELHRAVCRPLGDADPDDLEAARRLLAHRGAPVAERACQSGEGQEAIGALLEAAPGLMRLSSAVRIRAAARLLAMGQVADGRRLLDEVPESMRGTAWSVLAAWGARLDGDPVTATRTLSRLSPEALDRLRSSGDEYVARLVTQAWAQAQP